MNTDTEKRPRCYKARGGCLAQYIEGSGELTCYARPDDLIAREGVCAEKCPWRTAKPEEKPRDLGDFWKVQAQLVQTLQLDIARTLQAKRLHGEPTAPQELREMADSLALCGGVYSQAMWAAKGEEPV